MTEEDKRFLTELFDGIQRHIDSVETEIKALKKEMGSTNNEIKSLQKSVGKLEEMMDSLEDSLEEQIGQAELDVLNSLGASFCSMDDQFGEMKEDINKAEMAAKEAAQRAGY